MVAAEETIFVCVLRGTLHLEYYVLNIAATTFVFSHIAGLHSLLSFLPVGRQTNSKVHYVFNNEFLTMSRPNKYFDPKISRATTLDFIHFESRGELFVSFKAQTKICQKCIFGW